jgi:hypothetical protein
MKVLVYNFGDHNSPHLETQADLIQQHLDRGDQVVLLVCSGDMPICLSNDTHRLGMCAYCICRRVSGLSLIRPRVPQKSIFNLTARDRETVASFSFEGERLSELKELAFENFDIGLAVAASLVDRTRDPDPNLQRYREQVRDWIGVSLAAYLSTLNTLDTEKPDRVYVLNGRWGYTRAVLRACQRKGVDCHCHDRGGDLDRFLLIPNRLLHEIAGYEADIEAAWQKADPATREQIGSTFFEEKARGIERQWHSYVTGQKQGQLPEDWDPKRRNIAVFLGSEFEYAAIGADHKYRFYKDQNHGVARIAASLEQIDAPVHLNVRVHPHMKGDRNKNLEELLALRSCKATIIPPESPVSSYGLLWACEKTLTFGSTVGIEAVYWGKPSILGGAGFYQDLGGTYNPSTHEELIEMLLADLPPRPKEPALKYGYYELLKGVEHVHYEAETLFRGKFKGKYVEEATPWFWRVIRKIAMSRFYRILEWFGPAHHRRTRRRLGIKTSPEPAPNGRS